MQSDLTIEVRLRSDNDLSKTFPIGFDCHLGRVIAFGSLAESLRVSFSLTESLFPNIYLSSNLSHYLSALDVAQQSTCS